MSDQNNSEKKMNVKRPEERILVGERPTKCFACGSEIDGDPDVCPYCGIELKKKNNSKIA